MISVNNDMPTRDSVPVLGFTFSLTIGAELQVIVLCPLALCGTLAPSL